MRPITKSISDELFEKAKVCLKQSGRDGEIGRRLQAIISAKQYGITAVSKILQVTRKTILSWIRKFEAQSVAGLTIQKGRGRKPKTSPDSDKIIRDTIEANPNITIDALRQKLREEFSMNLGRSTVHRRMKQLNFSYITPRPRHYKSDPKAQEDFKKKTARPSTKGSS